MEYELPRCIICGEYATHAVGVGEDLNLCNNIVCYHAAVELIEHALEECKE